MPAKNAPDRQNLPERMPAGRSIEFLTEVEHSKRLIQGVEQAGLWLRIGFGGQIAQRGREEIIFAGCRARPAIAFRFFSGSSATAFSILLFTECRMLSGFFLKKKPPCTMLEMSTSESKTL
jgi:hypothetical protein